MDENTHLFSKYLYMQSRQMMSGLFARGPNEFSAIAQSTCL
jgi:hypothetical protein